MRLSKTIRQAIHDAAMAKAGVPEKKLAIRQRYADWAEAVRVRYVTPEVQQLVQAARDSSAAVPGFIKDRAFRFTENSAIEKANVAGQSRTVYFCGALNYNDRDDSRRSIMAPGYGGVTLTADDPLTEQLFQIDHDAEQLKAEVEQLSLSLWAVLNSCHTDTKLIELWPEAVAFIPAAEKASQPQLPALPIADLNKMIGLP